MGRFLLFLLLLAPSILRAQSPAGGLTPEQWRADLAYLAKELPSRHINAFARISKTDFEAQVKDLDNRIPKLADGAIRSGILKLVASVGDGHTTVQAWGQSGAFPALPLVFYWYKDGVFVIGSTEPHRQLLGSKLLRVGKLSVEDACRKLGIFVPHENEAQLKAQVPNMLMRFELLQEIGATEDAGRIRLEFQPAAGDRMAVEIEPAVLRERPQWIWAYTGEPPLYQRDRNLPYFADKIAEGSTVYFRYNNCVNDPRKPFPQFAEAVKKMLAQPGVNRLIVDLRNNGGGNSAILDPFIGWLKTSSVNRKGSLYVLIGRSTFSSAILNAVRLRNDTAAILAGEPTGGKPNHFGELRSFELPNSHIRVSYSTKYFHEFKDDTPSLMPDLPVELTSADYMAGADPVLAAIMR